MRSAAEQRSAYVWLGDLIPPKFARMPLAQGADAKRLSGIEYTGSKFLSVGLLIGMR